MAFGLQNAGNDGTQGARHNEHNAQQHVGRDDLPVEQPGQDGGQGGLEEVDQGDHAGGLILHSQEVGAEADSSHTGGDEEHIGEVLQGVARQNGDVGEGGQLGVNQGLGHRRDVGDENKDQHDEAAEQKTEAGHHRAAVLRALFLAQYAVDGEQQGGQQGQKDTPQVEPGVEGIDDGNGARNLQYEGGNIAPQNGLPQHKEGKKRDKHRVAAEEHGHHGGVGVIDGQMEDGHAQGDAGEAKKGKVAQGFGVQMLLPLFQGVQSQGEQEQKSDGEPGQGELDRVNLTGDEFQNNLEGAEHNHRHCDVEIAFLHKKCRLPQSDIMLSAPLR